jgi:hypothetical protein
LPVEQTQPLYFVRIAQPQMTGSGRAKMKICAAGLCAVEIAGNADYAGCPDGGLSVRASPI